ncbi:hypothetical protein [Glycomyces paridis]|uniref:Uncharacterized protein n=1 Tax=Glycomyces paridis TaxID=2126555 RepID=A0A4S8PUD0_9ACTN|nr:hypothetical protein [Glycomyces paridis]THV31949.1 hypothetical protein E9998_00340 [Glycomyces paridis]
MPALIPKLRALHRRLGRPSAARLAAVAGPVLAASLAALAFWGDLRLLWAASSLMSLLTLGAVALGWSEARRARVEARESAERTEFTYRKILAAFEAERLAGERRRAAAGER